jgi:hypothetical protein
MTNPLGQKITNSKTDSRGGRTSPAAYHRASHARRQGDEPQGAGGGFRGGAACSKVNGWHVSAASLQRLKDCTAAFIN